MGTLAVGTKALNGIRRVPQCSHIVSQYNIGEKPTVILYTCINRRVGTPKQKQGSHEEVWSLEPMIPPKRFDIFPPDWGMLRRSRCVQIFLYKHDQSRCSSYKIFGLLSLLRLRVGFNDHLIDIFFFIFSSFFFWSSLIYSRIGHDKERTRTPPARSCAKRYILQQFVG